jgi:hypothetical protein
MVYNFFFVLHAFTWCILECSALPTIRDINWQTTCFFPHFGGILSASVLAQLWLHREVCLVSVLKHCSVVKVKAVLISLIASDNSNSDMSYSDRDESNNDSSNSECDISIPSAQKKKQMSGNGILPTLPVKN